jgi:quercetin 2,3-dioxygenase
MSRTQIFGYMLPKLLIIDVEPLNEHVVHYGRFVMNTRQEIVDAVNDYQNGVLVK